MNANIAAMNALIVDIFNNILQIEEETLKNSEFKDLSIKEIHTIEAIGIHGEPTMSDVANKLGITLGTLTVAINNLVKKSYVKRIKCEIDKRVVRVRLTMKGRFIYRLHERFHKNLIECAIKDMDEAETLMLNRALLQLHGFFTQQLVKKNVDLENNI